MNHALNGIYRLQENDTAFKYSDNPEALKKTLENTEITIRVVGEDKFFDDDKEDRLILRVSIRRNEKAINFRFGMSIRDTTIFSALHVPVKIIGGGWIDNHVQLATEKKKIKNGLLYSILACIRSDYICPDTFGNFCHEFGYDTDSRKAEKTFFSLQEQSKKLQTIFTAEEIESFPS
jgi:hypothetical protein